MRLHRPRFSINNLTLGLQCCHFKCLVNTRGIGKQEKFRVTCLPDLSPVVLSLLPALLPEELL